VTSNPPEVEAPEQGEESEEVRHPLADYADHVAETVGGEAVITFDTIKVSVPAERWVEALTAARDELDLVLFSFLSAIDWSNETAVGDPLEEPLEEEYFEVICTVSDLTEGRRVTFSTRLDHTEPVIDSLIDVYAGANWHEREAHEMFGIRFAGHPDLSNLYLPNGFLGNPLRKTFPLLSREVKPWPGKVDVEAMPEEEEAEGADGDEEPASESEDGEEA
jgi:NADH-quinone oxidoreductase subunit C